jgi:hypothetical protein
MAKEKKSNKETKKAKADPKSPKGPGSAYKQSIGKKGAGSVDSSGRKT